MHKRTIKTLSHCYYEMKYHLVWTPKYRGKVLGPQKIREELKRTFESITKWKHWDIIELNIQDDHIHSILSASPRDSVSYMMQLIKGKSSAWMKKKIKRTHGLVVVVFDDINLTGSQGVFDSRQFRAITGGIWLEPKTIQECYDYAFNSFKKSEESGLPLVIRMSNTNTQLTGSIICSNKQQKSIIPYVKNFDAHVVHPITGNAQFEKWVLKNKNLDSSLDSNSVGVVSKDLLVNMIVFPTVNKNYNTEQHIVTNKFENLYSILRNNNYIVSVDLGGYTADYLKTADMCLCFGASTAVAGGVKNILPDTKAAAVIGDTPFLHSGKNVLPELVLRNLCIDIFVLDNGGSQGTGGQVVPGSIEKEAMIYDVEYVKLYLSEVELTLKKIMTKPERTRVFHILYN